MGAYYAVLLILAFLRGNFAQDVSSATVIVDGANSIAKTDDNFICATLDWWPQDKCNYNQCPWGNSSVINLNLSHPLLTTAIKAFNNLRIRIGGSLQDQVLYDIGKLKYPCHPFKKTKDGLFGFSKGCLHMKRWDELNDLFCRTRAVVTFSLNELYGKHRSKKDFWIGDWDSSNAYNFMKYTVSKGYQIDSWELGNELCGSGVSARVGANQYGKDVIELKRIIDNTYKNSTSKPTLVAPGGFYDTQWFKKFLQVSASGVVDVVTHHIYNLGPGDDPNLKNKIRDPKVLNKISETFSNLKETIEKHGPWTSAWVGESGGAYNSGGRHVSNTFLNSFWYLDQLGMSSKYNTTVYCRQSLIGGNYGLLDTTTFVPNPDYYSALLWHRLMGKCVLSAHTDDSPYLRTYAHCSKEKSGVTLLLINLSNQTTFTIEVHSSMRKLHIQKISNREHHFQRILKSSVAWVGTKVLEEELFREEYHLTPLHGDLQSQTMVLNGKPLKLTHNGEIPELENVLEDMRKPISIAPSSIAFVVIPNFDAPGCN